MIHRFATVPAPCEPPPTYNLTVRFDSAPLRAAWADLGAAADELRRLEVPPAQIGEHLFLDGQFMAELFNVVNDIRSASGTSVTIVRFEPSDGLLETVAALRARQQRRMVVEDSGHD